MKLSLLIPSTHNRFIFLNQLLQIINFQIKPEEKNIEVITNIDDGTLSIGMKRNLLLLKATGDYVCFIDDDDEVPGCYINDIMQAIDQRPDVVGFMGYMTTNGTRRENFKISKDLSYQTLKDGNGNNYYIRFNNHLCPIKREIALQIMFPDIRNGEDYDYAVRLKNSGLIKTEIFIPKDLYHYKFRHPK